MGIGLGNERLCQVSVFRHRVYRVWVFLVTRSSEQRFQGRALIPCQKEVFFCILYLELNTIVYRYKTEEFLEPILAYTHFVAKNKDPLKYGIYTNRFLYLFNQTAHANKPCFHIIMKMKFWKRKILTWVLHGMKRKTSHGNSSSYKVNSWDIMGVSY